MIEDPKKPGPEQEQTEAVKATKKLIPAQRAMIWAKVLAVALPAAVATYAAFVKGEPEAELAYEHLAEALNKYKHESDKGMFALSAKVDKELAFVHGFLDGFRKPRETQKLEKLSKKLEKAPRIVCRAGFKLVGDACIQEEPKPKKQAKGGNAKPTKPAMMAAKADTSPKPKMAAKTARPDLAKEARKILTYIVASKRGWSFGEQLAAKKLAKLAKHRKWTFEEYVKNLAVVHSKLRGHANLPRTLKKLKARDEEQEQMKMQAHEKF